MKINILFTILCSMLTVSCHKIQDDGCLENIICTENYASIIISLNDRNGLPVNLEYPLFIISKFEASGRIIENDQTTVGYYNLISDNELKNIQKTGTSIILDVYRAGFAGNDLILSEKYLIGHDCCHVIKISGKDIIVID